MMKNVNEHAKANEEQEIEKEEKHLCFIFYDGICMWVTVITWQEKENKKIDRKE